MKDEKIEMSEATHIKDNPPHISTLRVNYTDEFWIEHGNFKNKEK